MPSMRTCLGCGKEFNSTGISNHQRKCLRTAGKQQSDADFEASRLAQRAGAVPKYVLPKLTEGLNPGDTSGPASAPEQPTQHTLPRLGKLSTIEGNLKGTLAHRVASDSVAPAAVHLPRLKAPPTARASSRQAKEAPNVCFDPVASTRESEDSLDDVDFGTSTVQPPPQIDDIRTTYHPHSGRSIEVKSFEDYGKPRPAPPPPRSTMPWLPFHSESEFSFAEIIHESAMSNKQVDALIKVVHKLLENKESFMVKNHKELEQLWIGASDELAPFVQTLIELKYRGELRTFDFWSRSLMDWATNVLEDPFLASICEWDAVILEKFDGKQWVPFVHEPWTGKRMWSVQDQLPEDGKPLCITLYADKTRLSSFGTAQGYPIMAQINNLPHDIRNGKGLGSTQVVGWLPIVAGEETDKSGFVDFKRAVWHKSFEVLLEKVTLYSATGYKIKCGDGVWRRLFPFIFVLAADYEEQTVMALTRGVNGKFPCPVCLVPNAEQSNLGKTHPLRTAKGSKALVDMALQKTTAVARDNLLSTQSLRPVVNAFWSVRYSDPHRAITFDEMHANDHGLGGKHFFPQLKLFVTKLGSKAAQQVDDQMKMLPPWRGLQLHSKVMSVHFADANDFRDILKMFIFTSHNVITKHNSPIGYLFLRCLRAYLDLTMWQALEVHTTDTIASGRKAVKRLGELIEKYTNELSEESQHDNHDFPKFHAQDHVFHDIEQKGVLRNFSTRLFERLHGPLKTWYQRKTNFKNVAPQILQNEHFSLASSIIRAQIDASNVIDEDDNDEVDGMGVHPPSNCRAIRTFGNVYLGSPQKRRSVDHVETTHSEDPAFCQFRSRYEKFLDGLLRRDDSPVEIQSQRAISVAGVDFVIEQRFIKPSYESLVDWRAHTDYLRCSPMYYGRERRDCVIVASNPQPYFAQLLFVFTYKVKGSENIFILDGQDDVTIPVALVLPFVDVTQTRDKDRDLCLHRLQAKPRGKAIFIPARSILRGAYIVPEGVDKDSATSLLVDVVDTDMFLRIRSMYSSSL